jgi:hypothetical protein
MTDDEMTQSIIREHEEFVRALEAEPNPAKRRRLFKESQVKLEQELAQIAVEIVERVRARDGDEAAEKTLQALRRAGGKS